ncbi:hypothetical protein EKG38_13945 [Shewanella canadensis]|uniref:Uncharacterized protein n=1 Tax=Shewanella canadensis TaxID=271096 RepID=A0A3S0RXJ5_9GAMM|nr:hypothetical protein [Shewanella canadensis]RTR38601.1 hypothetical protein EKG38_13945 [Shewanella canadensis]
MSLHLLGRVALPYCLELLGGNCIRVLNREYSPIGFATERLTLTSEVEKHTRLKLRPSDIAKLKKLAVSPTEENWIFLYDDKSSPDQSSTLMDAYFGKLKVLSSIELLPD